MSVASFGCVPLQYIHFCRLDLSKSLYGAHKFWVCPFTRHSHLQPRLCILAILHVSHIDSCGSLSFTVLRGCHVWSGHVLSQFAPDSCLTCNRQGTCVCKRHQLLPFILLT